MNEIVIAGPACWSEFQCRAFRQLLLVDACEALSLDLCEVQPYYEAQLESVRLSDFGAYTRVVVFSDTETRPKLAGARYVRAQESDQLGCTHIHILMKDP